MVYAPGFWRKDARAAATITWAVSAGLLMRMSYRNIWLWARPETPLRSMRTPWPMSMRGCTASTWMRSEEHTSELQSRENLVCRLLLEKKKKPCNENGIIEWAE